MLCTKLSMMLWLNSKYGMVMQMAALSKMSYTKVTQKHFFFFFFFLAL